MTKNKLESKKLQKSYKNTLKTFADFTEGAFKEAVNVEVDRLSKLSSVLKRKNKISKNGMKISYPKI